MVSVTSASRYITSASRYHPRYQSRSSMYIRGSFHGISRNSPRQFRLVMDVLFYSFARAGGGGGGFGGGGVL